MQDSQASLGQGLRRVGMLGGQPQQPCDFFIDAGVVLHRAGTERVKSRVHAVVPGGEPRKVADDFQLGNFRKARDLLARQVLSQHFGRRDGGDVQGRQLDADLAGRAALEDQPFAAVDVRSSYANAIFHGHRFSLEGGLNLQPSPPWGRGWTATGAFSSRGGPGEGVTRKRLMSFVYGTPLAYSQKRTTTVATATTSITHAEDSINWGRTLLG